MRADVCEHACWVRECLLTFETLCWWSGRLGEILLNDGQWRAARPDPETLLLAVREGLPRAERGPFLQGGGLLHGDLQWEGPRPAGSQRVSGFVTHTLLKFTQVSRITGYTEAGFKSAGCVKDVHSHWSVIYTHTHTHHLVRVCSAGFHTQMCWCFQFTKSPAFKKKCFTKKFLFFYCFMGLNSFFYVFSFYILHFCAIYIFLLIVII